MTSELFVVQALQSSPCSCDVPQWIQTALWERHGVRTLRRTLEQIADDSVASLTADGSLTVDGATLLALCTTRAVILQHGSSPVMIIVAHR